MRVKQIVSAAFLTLLMVSPFRADAQDIRPLESPRTSIERVRPFVVDPISPLALPAPTQAPTPDMAEGKKLENFIRPDLRDSVLSQLRAQAAPRGPVRRLGSDGQVIKNPRTRAEIGRQTLGTPPAGPGVEGPRLELPILEGPGLKDLPPPQPLKAYENPITSADAKAFYLRQIVLKLREGAPVRLRDGALKTVEDPDTRETLSRLGRSGLEPSEATDDAATITALVERRGGTISRATPGVSEADLALLRRAAEANSRGELPDLNTYFFVLLPDMPVEESLRLLGELQALRSVEVAYFQPIPANAQLGDRPPTTTINLAAQQGYLRPAPGGVDVDFARLIAGGRGADVRIADIEAGWTTDHEDLPAMGFGFGLNIADREHGTAVFGVLAAQTNGFGVDGIAPDSAIGWSSVTSLAPVFFYSVGNALLMTVNVLRPGDIALIEQHFPTGATAPPNNTCNVEQFGYVAVESVPYEHSVISVLTRVGIIVVEAAGNGQTLVTPASTVDSGAIVVGASGGGDLTPACFTNFGPRVDVHGWGGSVATLGYGTQAFARMDAAGNLVFDTNGQVIFDVRIDPTLRANAGDATQFYTRSFAGTSSASPIVAGAAALVQSARTAAGRPRLDPFQMRTLLASTGTPQAAGSAPNIGPLPNLRAAFASFLPDGALFVSQSATPASVSPGAPLRVDVTFRNTGGQAWTGGHSVRISDLSGTAVWPVQSSPAGAAPAPINPGQTVGASFAIAAPMQPGTYPLAFSLRDPNNGTLATSPQVQIVVAGPSGGIDNASATVVSAPTSLNSGQSTSVTVRFTNTGNTTWSPGSYFVQLGRTLRASLPQQTAALPATTAPGGSVDVSFGVICNGSGIGYWTAQLRGPTGALGATASRSINCL